MPTPKKHPNQAEKQRAYRERQREARRNEQQAKGLPALPSIPTLPGTTRWRAMVEAALVQLETTRDEMESYVAERSEAWQESDRAGEYRTHIETIEGAIAMVEEIEL
ncbi:MAG: hypothetical protein EOO38_04140 [Cytophagaceae bacterium]|nr:MAG: hypothetical protein EOO38_04140 [Cytophagaceae bacterium]